MISLQGKKPVMMVGAVVAIVSALIVTGQALRPRVRVWPAAPVAAAAPLFAEPTSPKSQLDAWGKNPFIADRHPGEEDVAPKGPTLSGILWDPVRRWRSSTSVSPVLETRSTENV